MNMNAQYRQLARLLELSEKYPDLKAEQINAGGKAVTRLTLASGPPSPWVDYWEVDAPNGNDAWRYSHSHSFGADQEYTGGMVLSHPSREGAWIMAQRYFIDVGAIAIPRDNSHLDPITAKMVETAQSARDPITKPLVGDLIEDIKGNRRRFSVAAYGGDSMQATKSVGGSFHLSQSGLSSFSGTCGGGIKLAELRRNGKDLAKFWMFKKDRPAAGNGADLWVSVTVWDWPGDFADVWG